MKSKNLNWRNLVAEFAEMVAGGYEGTAVDVILGSDECSIEIYPASNTTGRSFHHLDEVVDFCRVKRLSHYVSFGEYNGRIVPYVHIF